MDNIRILDCSLRDGGYVNDWNFGHNVLVNIFQNVVSAGIDYIEVGFLDSRRPCDINRSIGPNTECFNQTYRNLDKKNTVVVGMIDYGTCPIENLSPKKDSFLDGIRVIFKKHLKEKALAFCAEVKQLGYKVFAQAVSITSYDDTELLDLIRLANEVEPYALSIVDTYGLLHKNQLFHYYEMMDRNLLPGIGIGYHAHNNFQLGYANCIELMNHHHNNPRILICDGSVFGMGKGAGNAPTELLAMYMNQNFGASYDISHLLEAIDTSVLDIYRKSPWGYQMKFFIAASNDCHPNYVSYLLDKRSLSVKAINEILSQLKGEKKLLYDKDYIETLYLDYQKEKCDDERSYAALSNILREKKVLLIGPGKSVSEHSDAIDRFIRENNPAVISVNYIPEQVRPDFIFLTNHKRYIGQLSNLLNGEIQTIATSNLTKTSGDFDFRLDFESLLIDGHEFKDNSFLMCIRALHRAGISPVFVAGFDGYSEKGDSFLYSQMEYEFLKSKGQQINSDVRSFFGSHPEIDVKSLTPNLYGIPTDCI